jgi:hypothetical protein
MSDNAYNVEDNVQTPLLGHDIDSKTPLRHHHNAWIRLPTRFIVRIENTTHIAAFIVSLWHGIPQSVSALGEVLWQDARAFPAVLYRSRWLMPLFAIIVIAGVFLVIQGSRGELNIFLMLLFAWGMVVFAIVARLNNRPEED